MVWLGGFLLAHSAFTRTISSLVAPIRNLPSGIKTTFVPMEFTSVSPRFGFFAAAGVGDWAANRTAAAEGSVVIHQGVDQVAADDFLGHSGDRTAFPVLVGSRHLVEWALFAALPVPRLVAA